MPLEPRELAIMRNLQTALRAISTADDYHFSVAALAVKLDPNQGIEELIAPDGPRPFIVLEYREDAWLYEPANQMQLRLPCTIHWVSESDVSSDESRLVTYLKGCADIERAIAIDSGRGGLAVDTRILKRTYDTAIEGTQVWAMIETEITVYRTYGQPNG